MPYIRGDINLATELRRQRPRLFSAPLRIVYAPQRHKTISTHVYHPQTHLDEPGIFLSLGSAFIRMKPDQLDALIQHLNTHRDSLLSAYNQANEICLAYGSAIKNSNLVVNNDSPSADLLQSSERKMEEVGIPSVLPHGGDPLQSSSENVPEGEFLEGITATPDTAAPLEINDND